MEQIITFAFGFIVGFFFLALLVIEKSKTHYLTTDAKFIARGIVKERPDDAEPGIAEGVMFYCPSCKASVLDAWMTNAKIGDRVRCPSCKQGFNVTARADGEENTVLVQP